MQSARMRANAEGKINRFRQSFWEAGEALWDISSQQLYRETHSTFDEYCSQKWDFTPRSAYYLIAAFQVLKNLRVNNCSQNLPANEAQARPLASLKPEQQVIAWRNALLASNNKPTALHVEQAVKAIKQLKPTNPDVTEGETDGQNVDETPANEAEQQPSNSDQPPAINRDYSTCGWRRMPTGGGRYYEVILHDEETGILIESLSSQWEKLPQTVMAEAVKTLAGISDTQLMLASLEEKLASSEERANALLAELTKLKAGGDKTDIPFKIGDMVKVIATGEVATVDDILPEGQLLLKLLDYGTLNNYQPRELVVMNPISQDVTASQKSDEQWPAVQLALKLRSILHQGGNCTSLENAIAAYQDYKTSAWALLSSSEKEAIRALKPTISNSHLETSPASATQETEPNQLTVRASTTQETEPNQLTVRASATQETEPNQPTNPLADKFPIGAKVEKTFDDGETLTGRVIGYPGEWVQFLTDDGNSDIGREPFLKLLELPVAPIDISRNYISG